ncbi:MAG: response regulator [Burkholderiaceae bacterium]
MSIALSNGTKAAVSNNTASPFNLIASQRGRNTLQEEINNLHPLMGRSALIVDGALASRRALQEQLSQLGAASIRYACSTLEVARALEAANVDLIICEYQLDDHRTGQQLLEELQLDNRLPWSTSFIMITGERKYTSVLGVMEFEPDDYLIKPFTSSQLAERVIRLFVKKNALYPVSRAHGTGEFKQALALCDQTQRKHPAHGSEIFKLRIKSHMALGENDQAELLLHQAIADRPAPWMNMALARVQTKRSNFISAEKELRQLVTEKPEFTAARDLLADVLWELNRPDESLEILEQIGSAGLNNVNRLRKLADLSIRLNDNARAKQYLQKVIDRTQGTVLARADDFVNLSTALINEGRQEDADRVVLKMRHSLKNPDMEVARILIAVKRESFAGANHKAQTLLEKALTAFEAAEEMPSPMIHISLIESCFDLGLRDRALSHARQLAMRGAHKSVLDRLRASMDKSKKLAGY